MGDLGQAFRDLELPDSSAARDRAIKSVLSDDTAPKPSSSNRWRRFIVPVLVVLVGAPSGYAVAKVAQSDPEPLSLDEKVELAVQEEEAISSSVDAMWALLAERAERGELNADIDQAEAAEILRAAIDPPSDPKAANEHEDQMIALTETLRASGDMPQLNDPSRFNADGTIDLDAIGR